MSPRHHRTGAGSRAEALFRSRYLLPVGGALLLPVLLAPLLARGSTSITLVVATGAGIAAWVSPALPAALDGLPAVVVSVAGSNPLPAGATVILMSAWAVMGIGFAAWRRPDRFPLALFFTPPIVLSVALGIFMLIRLGSSASEAYGSEKLQLYVVVNVIAVVLGAVVAREARHFELFTLVQVAVAALASLALLRAILTGSADEVFTGRLSLSAEYNPIFLARSLAQGVVLSVWIVASRRSGAGGRLLCLAILPVFAITMIATGSRGPLLALLAALAVLLTLLLKQGRGLRYVIVLLAMLVLSVLVVPHALNAPQAIDRSLSLFTDAGSGVSANGRDVLWSDAIESFRAHPVVGLGTGGFESVQPVERYPHNLILEVGAELGIVGLVLLVGILAAGVGYLRKAWRTGQERIRIEVALVAALLTAAFVDASLSGDITGNRAIWFAVGLAVGLAWRSETDVPEA